MKPSFKFLNQWAKHEDFLDIVRCVWNQRIVGNPLFQFTTKLSMLKIQFGRKHQHSTSHIAYRVFRAKGAWEEAQRLLDSEPSNVGYKSAERYLAEDYMNLCKEEEAFFRQRSRVQWLKLGDQNTKFFHRSLIHRTARNSIGKLQDANGRTYTDRDTIGNMAVTYFSNLLQAPRMEWNESVEGLFPCKLSAEASTCMSHAILDDEIQRALFSIQDDKSPGPDGFYKFLFQGSMVHCW
ncbi:hypothetical protein OIU78_010889 [Salix suchowensis]|nr:hypothetical protein OIU78_010889 [Salix suchowensis]